MITDLSASLRDLRGGLDERQRGAGWGPYGLCPGGGAEPRGIDEAGHARLVGAFVEAGELAQGLADAETAARGRDGRGPTGDAAIAVLVSLAHAIEASWHGGVVDPAPALRGLEALSAARLPEEVRTRRAEGYAFYAVYPEAYQLAARRAAARRPGARRVIGVRSIGAGLAAAVSAAVRAPLPSTVRPVGDALRRTLAAAPELVREWTEEDPRATIAVVDEGPGLSGSSFGAVIDALEARGVPLDRIECYPSHGGELGPAAAPRHRERWALLRRQVVDCDELLVRSGRLARWIEARVGPLAGPLEDVSAGAWRARRYPSEAAWPPAVVHQERRKLLAHTERGSWLARFVGLGTSGDRAWALARTLHGGGFVPEPCGLVHGFLIERWLGDARPLDPRAIDRRMLVERVGRYLAFRARHLPAHTPGATAAELLVMARRNAGLALGGHAERALDRWAPRLPDLERRMRRIAIDGRLHAWEWLVRGDGGLVKADALDHHAAHDLVGCQDLAWDLAGAACELGLADDERDRLAAIAGLTPDPELLAFMRITYLAFQLGRHALAIGASDPAEAARLEAAAAAYGEALRAELQSTDAAASGRRGGR